MYPWSISVYLNIVPTGFIIKRTQFQTKTSDCWCRNSALSHLFGNIFKKEFSNNSFLEPFIKTVLNCSFFFFFLITVDAWASKLVTIGEQTQSRTNWSSPQGWKITKFFINKRSIFFNHMLVERVSEISTDQHFVDSKCFILQT